MVKKVYALVWEGVYEWGINGLFTTRKQAEDARGYDEEVHEYTLGTRYEPKRTPPKAHVKNCNCLTCRLLPIERRLILGQFTDR
jgi:hypothetical protein